MKKILLNILLSCVGMQLCAAELTLPQEFTILHDWDRIAPSFTIEADGQLLGTAVRRLYRPTPTYTFCDSEGHQLATGQAEILSLLTKINVSSNDGQALGRLEEDSGILFPNFRLIDAEDTVIARARLNFWGTRFSITDPSDESVVMATISRPFFRAAWKPSCWTVRIEDDYVEQMSQHAVLFTLMAIYQSDRERVFLANFEDSDLKPFSDDSFTDVTFSEEDEDAVIHFVDSYLEQITEMELASEEECTILALERIEALLDPQNETLSLSEKAALCYLVEQRLRSHKA